MVDASDRDSLRVLRFRTPPVARFVGDDEGPTVADIEVTEVRPSYAAGAYRVADLHGLGEHSVVDTRTGKTDFRTTDRSLAVTVAHTFDREGV